MIRGYGLDELLHEISGIIESTVTVSPNGEILKAFIAADKIVELFSNKVIDIRVATIDD